MRRTSCKLGNDCFDDAFVFLGQNRFAHDLGGRPSPVRLQLRGCQRRGRAGTSKSQQRYVALQQIRRSIFYSLFISGAKKLDATSTRTSPTWMIEALSGSRLRSRNLDRARVEGFVSSIPTSHQPTKRAAALVIPFFLKTTPCKVEIRVTRLCRNLK